MNDASPAQQLAAQELSEEFAKLITALDDIPTSLTIPLDPPVKIDNREYTQLVLHEPTVEQVRQAEEQMRSGMAPHLRRNYELHLIAKAAEVPLPVVQKLGVSKLNAAMVYMNSFLYFGRPTGAT